MALTSAERSKNWREKHPERVKRLAKISRDKHKESRQKLNREWIKNNKERYNASKYIYRDNLKLEIMEYYSGAVCCGCGCDDIDVLCLDHIDNDGATERKRLSISSRGNRAGCTTYAALKKEGYPPGLQVLCANCNLKKEIMLKRKHRMKNKFYASHVAEEVMPSVDN